MRVPWIALFTAGLLLGEVDPRELVRKSIANGEKSWRLSRSYSCIEREVKKRAGVINVYEVKPIGGSPYERLIQRNGKPLPPAEQRKQEEQFRKAIAQAARETPARRLAKEERERAFMKEIPDAFDFKLVGEEALPTGPAYVLQATPRPGYRPRSRYAKAFSKMSGKLWIDKKDIQWVKADAVAMDNVSFGFFIARMAKGAHIVLEQMRLPDGVWVPKQFAVKANARIMLVKSRNFDEQITYSNYRKMGPPKAATLAGR